MKQGFSLIELMIVLLLIGILSLISYPLYNEHLIRVRRVQIAATLLDLAGCMEEYYALHQTYEEVTVEKLLAHNSQHKNYYVITVDTDKDSYTLRATPINQQAKDATCGTLTLDQNGNRGANENKDNSMRCWL